MAASASRDGRALAGRPPLALHAGVAQDIARVNARLSPPRQTAANLGRNLGPPPARLGKYSAHCPSDGARTAGEGPAGSTFRAKPFPEVTAPICRLPLPTFTYGPEASHLGDLMRIRVRPDQTSWLEGTYLQLNPTTHHRRRTTRALQSECVSRAIMLCRWRATLELDDSRQPCQYREKLAFCRDLVCRESLPLPARLVQPFLYSRTNCKVALSPKRGCKATLPFSK